MLRLSRYLRRSLWIIFLILVLLILEAFCNLELPGYTSRIVTGGIQQKGIEDAVPDLISGGSLDRLRILLDKEDDGLLDRSYLPAGREGVYTLSVTDPDQRAILADVITPAEVLLMMLTSGSGTAESFSALSGVSASEGFALPDNALDILENLPDDMRASMLSQAYARISQLPDSTRTQAAIIFISQEYERLGEDTGKRQTAYLLKYGLRMLLLAFLAMVCTITVSFLSSRMAAGFAFTVRGDIFHKVLQFNDEEFHRFSTASLITRSTNDVQQVQMLLAMGLRMLLYSPVIAIGGIVKVVRSGASISWTIALAVVLLFALIIILFRIAMPRFTILQSLIDRLNLVSREQLSGVMVTRAFSAETREEERFEEANLNLTRTTLFVNRCMAIMMPVMMLILNGISVLIVYTGSRAVDAGTMQAGDVMAFIQYAMQIITSFLMISAMSIIIPRANVAAGRIAEVLSTDIRLTNPSGPVSPASGRKGTVEFSHVSFAYPDAGENVLTDISFKANRGETIAFIGSTGSGKSTLVSLIPRFYDVTQGSVRVDGVDVREMDLHDLRSRIGYVPQKSLLFSGTIASNIGYGVEEITPRILRRAASIAQAEDFIEKMEEGYASPVAQGGTNVSGGQRQRLAIARAIARDPEILIFDDSFSALDFTTDAALRQALRTQTRDTTTLIVAQRVSTILHADRIIVLDEGKMVGSGTHRELMKTCEIYRQIAQSQLSGGGPEKTGSDPGTDTKGGAANE